MYIRVCVCVKALTSGFLSFYDASASRVGYLFLLLSVSCFIIENEDEKKQKEKFPKHSATAPKPHCRLLSLLYWTAVTQSQTTCSSA